MRVYIQMVGKGFFFDGCFSAYEGILHKDPDDYQIILFEDIMEVPGDRSIMLVASIEDTQIFFKRLGMETPKALDIFDDLVKDGFIKREIRYDTLGNFINKDYKLPLFIKPRYAAKSFPSGPVKSPGNKQILLGKYDQGIECILSEIVDFVSEYRVFVDKRRGIVGMKHYIGDHFIFPDVEVIKKLVDYSNQHPSIPSAYTLDIGVTSDGKTEFIEHNDAWSIGSYGLDGEVYVNLLIKRWLELMKI